MLIKLAGRIGIAVLAAIVGFVAHAQAPSGTQSLDQLLGTMQLPPMRTLTLTLQPPPSLDSLLGTMQLPALRTLTLTLQPPPTLDSLLGTMQLPPMRSLMLTLQPPPALDPLLGSMQLPEMRSLTLTVQPPPGPVAPGFKPPALAVAEPAPTATDPAVLALIARAIFPVPQPLSVVLVPPPSIYSVIANASFPTPQPLSVVLVPPPSPYSAIASASFPVPQPLSVVLVPGAVQPATTLIAGFAPLLTLTTASFATGLSVQIVQVIPRRGANFFDRNDPTGLNTIVRPVVTSSGGGGPAPGACGPPTGAEVCGAFVSFNNDGVPFSGGSGNVIASPVGAAQVNLYIDSGGPDPACPPLACALSTTFTPNPVCNPTSFTTNGGVLVNYNYRYRRNGAQVCMTKLAF